MIPRWLYVLAFLARLAAPCLPASGKNQVSAGEATYVCITLSPLKWGVDAGAGKYLRIPSKVTADEFTRINVGNAWTSTDYATDAITSKLAVSATEGAGVAVSVSSMGVTSYQHVYRMVSGAVQRTFPLFLVTITVDKGKVISITWDDTCKWCDSNKCATGMYDFSGNQVTATGSKSCFVEDTTCGFVDATTSVVTPSALCDLHVYVTWSGIDGSGNYFQSAVRSFSVLECTWLSLVVCLLTVSLPLPLSLVLFLRPLTGQSLQQTAEHPALQLHHHARQGEDVSHCVSDNLRVSAFAD